MSGEAYMSVGSYLGGGRNQQYIARKFTRMGGWIGDPDPDGNPWGFVAYYPGAQDQVPTAGNFDMGFNGATHQRPTRISGSDGTGSRVKTGGLPGGPCADSSGALPTRGTIFGTHAVGTGTQRGWYLSAGSGGSLAGRYTDPKQMFTVSAGAFMRNGGSGRSLAAA